MHLITKSKSYLWDHIDTQLIATLIFSIIHNFSANQVCKWCLNDSPENFKSSMYPVKKNNMTELVWV